MEEYSRILIEKYCRKHGSKKSRWLAGLAEMPYDLYVGATDAIFLEELLEKKAPKLREVVKDFEDFCFRDKKFRIV